MTRKAVLWFVATGCAVAIAAAVPQAGQRAAQAPAGKPAPAPAAMKVDPRVATLKQQVLADDGEVRQTVEDIRLNGNQGRMEAGSAGGEYFCDHRCLYLEIPKIA